MEHIYELRKRLFYVALSVGFFSIAAYAVEHHIVRALLLPAQGQKFIYTSPGGGIDFLFRVCLYVGVALSIPVIIYQALRYIEPLIKQASRRFIAWGSAVSGFLALVGIAFGYFVGLPSSLHFLLHQFKTDQIQPLLTIQSYMSFVTLYLLGCALLFQVPLILILINRIKPLRPRKLLGYERWVILFAVIGGGVINPSPSVIDQAMLAGPIILMYQLGIVLIWAINRRHRRPKRAVLLLQQDAALRQARLERFRAAQAQLRTSLRTAEQPAKPAHTEVLAAPAETTCPLPAAPPTSAARRSRQIRYVNDFRPRRNYQMGQQIPHATEQSA